MFTLGRTSSQSQLFLSFFLFALQVIDLQMTDATIKNAVSNFKYTYPTTSRQPDDGALIEQIFQLIFYPKSLPTSREWFSAPEIRWLVWLHLTHIFKEKFWGIYVEKLDKKNV
jgi:hypothetical protein